MIWPYLFAGVIILVVLLKYLKLGGSRCPQCNEPREGDRPLCRECGGSFDDDDEDEDSGALEYGDPDAPEVEESPWDSQDGR